MTLRVLLSDKALLATLYISGISDTSYSHSGYIIDITYSRFEHMSVNRTLMVNLAISLI